MKTKRRSRSPRRAGSPVLRCRLLSNEGAFICCVLWECIRYHSIKGDMHYGSSMISIAYRSAHCDVSVNTVRGLRYSTPNYM